MELLLLLLLLGAVVVLFVQMSGLNARLRELEGRVAPGRHAEPEPCAEPEPAPRPVEERPPAPAPAPAPSPAGVVTFDWHPEEIREEPPERTETLGGLFERFVAGRLLIWIGGAALFVAGILLVRYSIEVGLITPAARMIGAATFGLVLIGGAEYARLGRFSDDPRIAQVLAGAGLAILYATAYGSHVLYGLLDDRAAGAAMVVVSAGALAMSLRHGAPTAVMGLIGGFLTPFLVGKPSASAIPLLAYLALLDLALFAIAWRRGWTWLAAAAVLLSFVWSGYVLTKPPGDALAGGVFVLLLGVAASLARPGQGRHLRLIQPLAIAALQLAALVARTDLGIEAWSLFGLLGAASIVLALLKPEYEVAPPVGLGLALILLAAKAGSVADPFVPEAAIGITLLFGGGGLALALWRGRTLWTGIAAFGLIGPALIVRALRPELLDRPAWGALFAALAVGPALLVWANRESASAGPPPSPTLSMAGAAAALLAGAAIWDLAPADLVAGGWLAVALAMALVARRLGDLAARTVALTAAAAGALRALAMVPDLWIALSGGLIGFHVTADLLPDALAGFYSLALPALLLAALHVALPPLPDRARWLLPAVAGLFGAAAAYVWFKQAFGLAEGGDFVARALIERTIITQALFLAGWLLGGRPALRRAGAALTALAAARLIWFDMILFNPVGYDQWVGTIPVLNLILPAYLLSALWLYAARRRAEEATRSGFWLAAFLAALIAGVALMVRQAFHGAILTGPELPLAETYGYSLAGLAVAIGLILAGMRIPDKALRLAGLLLLTATIVKVFLVDASELKGILRIISFLGLGIALIGIGRLYGPVLRAERDGA
ncbi:MAG TPA: DUF2339 domain-containing protein [Allosphingosinicella sp.]|nr:DUF2339 domain-containing protein [Allosphingosinicella sp.]